MGLLDTFRSALGLRRPLVVREPASFFMTEAARDRALELPEGQALVVQCVPAQGGHMVHVDERAPDGPEATALGARVHMFPEDVARCAGLSLDYDDGRWRVLLDLTVRAGETPNPHRRLYRTNRPLHRGEAAYVDPSTPEPPALGAQLLTLSGVRSLLLRENTVTVEREPDVAWGPLDRAIDAAIRQHFLLCGDVGEGASSRAYDDPLAEAIWEVLREEVLPGIHKDGGDLTLLGVRDGVVSVRMRGACESCPASTLTLKGGVERVLRAAFPGEVERVEAV